jgi:hypothetical protein
MSRMEEKDKKIGKSMKKGRVLSQENIDLIKAEIVDRRYNQMQARHTIIQWLVSEYPIASTRAYQLFNEAMEVMAEEYNAIVKEPLIDAINRLEKMKEDAYNTDRRLALEIQKELNKLHQLYVTKLQVEGELTFKADFGEEKTEEDETTKD